MVTAVTWWSWPVWMATAVLGGLVLATYVGTPDTAGRGGGAGATGGLLSALAVGCPVCNKLVVAALGVAGAMQWWAPLQPVLGVASVALWPTCEPWVQPTETARHRRCGSNTLHRWPTASPGGPLW